MFRKILVLVVGLTLPIVNAKGSEYVQCTLGGFNSSAVRNELVHRSPFSHDVLKCVDKLSVGGHRENINDKRLASNKELSHGSTTINGLALSKESVSSNRFIASPNIVGRERRLDSLQDVGPRECVGRKLCSVLKSLPNLLNRNIQKVGTVGLTVDGLRLGDPWFLVGLNWRGHSFIIVSNVNIVDVKSSEGTM